MKKLIIFLIATIPFVSCEKDNSRLVFHINDCVVEDENHTISVVVFLYENCPIAQYMCGPIRDTYKYFCDTLNQPILFRGFSPNIQSTNKSLEKFINKYDIPFDVFIDYDHINNQNGEWTSCYKPTVTPEVIVEFPIGQIVYRGMIDNSYLALGQWSPPTKNHLFDVLDQIIKGEEVTYYETTAVGCQINY